MSPSRLAFEEIEGVGFLTLRGEHDAYTAPRLERQIFELLADGTPVVVDLDRAAFIDSVVAGVLIKSHEHATATGARFLVLLGEGAGSEVRTLFELTHLASLLPVVATRDEALSSIRSTQRAA